MKAFLVIWISTCISFAIMAQDSVPDSIQHYKMISDLLQTGINEAINNNLDDCYKNFGEAYNLARQYRYYQLQPVIIIAHSRLYLIEDKYDHVFELISKAKPYVDQNPQSSQAADYYEILAQCYMHQKQWDQALQNLKKVEIIRAQNEPAKNWRTYNGMATVYHELHDDKLAVIYRQKASKLSKIQNSRRTLLDLQSELKFDEQSGTIATLQMQNLKAKNELQKAKFKNILLLTLLGAFILISGLLFYILRQRNQHSREMNIKNDIISKNLAEKEALVQEIHHRVKNNLQVISSLLSLQSRTLDDKNASDALLQGQSRVLAMSLIHQNLYKDGASSQLDIKEYLTNLSQQIFNTYNLHGNKIQIHTDIECILTDVNILVPIGLIVNELITNALKYAFVGKDSGNIWVKYGRQHNHLHLSVKDDGIGVTLDSKDLGFGFKLIDTFAKRLNATVTKKDHNGTDVSIIIHSSLTSYE